jgi:hypothetical protein
LRQFSKLRLDDSDDLLQYRKISVVNGSGSKVLVVSRSPFFVKPRWVVA